MYHLIKIMISMVMVYGSAKVFESLMPRYRNERDLWRKLLLGFIIASTIFVLLLSVYFFANSLDLMHRERWE